MPEQQVQETYRCTFRSASGGHLDPSWQEWLEHLQSVHEEDGTSRLSGTLPDQATLYGALHKLDRLSLTLRSLERNETRPEESG